MCVCVFCECAMCVVGVVYVVPFCAVCLSALCVCVCVCVEHACECE